jgi:ATP-binding cassette subfamily F protein 3
MLKVVNLTKSYGTRYLFEEVSFSLTPGERLGLVGRNGCGKSTLFRLILGQESPDDGEIVVPRGYRIGHLQQHLEFHEDTILKEVCLGLREEERDQEYRGEILLAGLGFSEEDFSKPPAAFSGGFQIRLNLVKLLLSEPNLLLLDEPTNYLDIVSMRWLSEFLCEWSGELIIISHDRLFMDSVTTDTMLIHRGSIRKMPGGTQKLYEQIALDEEIYEKTRVNENKKRKELEAVINRFKAKASKAAMAQSKMKELERMGQKEELQDIASLDFRFNEAPFPGKTVAEVKNLSFGYAEHDPLIRNLSFTIGKRDRIGIIGKNGKGKSTLLRLLANELQPSTGEINTSPNAQLGYFGQTNIARLSPELTVEGEVNSANPKLHRTAVRAICGTMMFSGDEALKKVSVLSGGEKSRVLLGKILALPTNFLLLDEPTNHLDMESIESLIESLKEYEGAVVIVTHSELILRELATRLVVFQEGFPKVWEHGYDYFLEKEGWGPESHVSGATPPAQPSQRKEISNSADANSKQQKKLARKVAAIEEVICKLELEERTIQAALAEASTKSDINALMDLSKRLNTVQAEIERNFNELEVLSQ